MFVVVTNQYSRARHEYPNADIIINNTDSIRGFHISPSDQLHLHGDELAGYPDGLLDEYQRLVREKRQGTGYDESVHHDLACSCCRKSFQSIFDNTIYCPDCERLFANGYCLDCGQIYGSKDHSDIHQSIVHGVLEVHGAESSLTQVPASPDPEDDPLEIPTIAQTEEAIESIESQPQTAEQATYDRMLEQEANSGSRDSDSNSGLIIVP